ncbi:MAG: bifunctional precorrin-2 dehydrogenase/sirohydrochlorin ferrochelatase [Cytophagales bacterium]|nr:bifunctional precorrin-2 dehydrogenase/sirohydrochlorin ferrochelatase [Cytophagales bacterium]
MNKLYPIFIKVDKINILIVGGGNVGLEKLNAIIQNNPDACISIVAPNIKPEIEEMASNHNYIILIKRKYEDNDLTYKHLVICATDDKYLHAHIYNKCVENNILINVADTPELCNVYLGSIVQKGDLKIAISTNGKSPTFAKRLKEVLNEVFISEDINTLLENLSAIRDKLKGSFQEKVQKMNEITRKLIEE